MKLFIIKVLKKIYKLIPIKQSKKHRIKTKIVNKFKFLKKFTNKQNRNFKNSIKDIKFSNIENITKTNSKIAVHLHLYYEDLAEEFIEYLNNIPFKFDLFISVKNEENISFLEDKFSKIKNVSNISIKETKNVGRDFSPMFITFKDDIKKYDYFLHMHSKKSIRTGLEQDGWRNHMINGLIGNKDIVTKIISLFESKKELGLIYPETYDDMPYWAHTYLKNKSKSNELASKFGFQIKDNYIDYSVGSFFWCRVDAIKPFLNLNLTWEDFGEEKGLADGTLAHAIERMIPQVITNNKYSYLVVDTDNNVFRHKGLKNLYQYHRKNKKECLETLKEFDIISFDIFDTLITRCVSSPSVIFDILEEKISKKFKISNFKNIRQSAEYEIRVKKNFIGDVSFDEIYDYIKNDLNLSIETINEIKNMEIDLEIKFSYPREDMLDIFNELKKQNKKIVLISDMYLTKEIITKMLNKCGYFGFDELLVSSELGLRKDNGTIWEYYFKEFVKNKSAIHVGDNEQSDVQQLCDMGKPFYHVMQSKKMFELSDYSDYLLSYSYKYNNFDKIALGLIMNKRIYNSPFVKNNNVIIDDFANFGYTFFGPIMYNYFKFLDKKIKENGYNKLLFLAREGHYLQRIYKDYCEKFNIREIDNVYFLTSRRASSVAAIENKNDAKDILKAEYVGHLDNLFLNRLGISNAKISDKLVTLPDDLNVVNNVLDDIYPKYESQFLNEKENYLRYCKQNISGSDKACVIDLGYSGTIQYYLIKLLNQNIDGIYLTLTDNVKPKKLGANCYGCFNSESVNNEKNIYLFSLILETFLTAPVGQLLNLDKNLNPIYKEQEIKIDFFTKMDEIFKGISDFFSDLSEYTFETDDMLSKDFIANNFSALIYVDDILTENIMNYFELDISYSLDEEDINVFEYLKKTFNNK